MKLQKLSIVLIPIASLLLIGATVATITESNLKNLTSTNAPALSDSAVIVLSSGPARLATLANIQTALGIRGTTNAATLQAMGFALLTDTTNAAAAITNGAFTFSLTVVTNGTGTPTLHFTNGVLGSITVP